MDLLKWALTEWVRSLGLPYRRWRLRLNCSTVSLSCCLVGTNKSQGQLRGRGWGWCRENDSVHYSTEKPWRPESPITSCLPKNIWPPFLSTRIHSHLLGFTLGKAWMQFVEIRSRVVLVSDQLVAWQLLPEPESADLERKLIFIPKASILEHPQESRESF